VTIATSHRLINYRMIILIYYYTKLARRPQRHTVDGNTSAGRTTDERPQLDGYSSAGKTAVGLAMTLTFDL